MNNRLQLLELIRGYDYGEFDGMFLPHVGIWVHTSFLCFSTVDGNVGLY
jgi:hypothetical protein